jgi:hypothetical protein
MGAEQLDGRSLPLLRGVLPIDTNKLVSHIVAGVTLSMELPGRRSRFHTWYEELLAISGQVATESRREYA